MKYILFFSLLSISIFAKGLYFPEMIKAEFIQKITSPDKKVETIYKGDMILLKNGSGIWNYYSPDRKVVCTHNNDITVVNHSLEQVNYFSTGTLNLKRLFIKAKPLAQNGVWLTKYDRKYTIKVDNEGKIEQIAFIDDVDNIVNIRLLNVNYSDNPNIKVDTQCHFPSSYDIITN
jgi:hypothetical protein